MRKSINTDKAPAAIGPYKHSNIYGNLVFTSGQVPFLPESGEVVGPGIKEQTRQTMENLGAVLEASGASYDTVLKATVFLKNMDDFAAVNEIYSEYFKGEMLPSRSAVEVARLPKDILIEIETIAYTK